MVTVLDGVSIEDMRNFLNANGTKETPYWRNLDGISQWAMRLKGSVGQKLNNGPLIWIQEMLQHDIELRPTARALRDTITMWEHNTDPGKAFCEACRDSNDMLWQHSKDQDRSVLGRGPDGDDASTDEDSTDSFVSFLFSDDLSESSKSSDVPNIERTFTIEVANALLASDDMKTSINSFIASSLTRSNNDEFHTGFLRAVREYAKELQLNAQGPLESTVANFVRGRYLLIAQTMEQLGTGIGVDPTKPSFNIKELDDLVEARVSSLSKVPEFLQSLPTGVGANIESQDVRTDKAINPVTDHDNESEQSASDDEFFEAPEMIPTILPHISMAEGFLLREPPFLTLLSMIQELIDKSEGKPKNSVWKVRSKSVMF